MPIDRAKLANLLNLGKRKVRNPESSRRLWEALSGGPATRRALGSQGK
jgi:hypothetical protein